jgi:NAD(P)H-dependent FMN reductase
MMAARLLAFSGSTRRESMNRRLLAVAVEAARAAGAQVTVLDLAQYPLPLYDGDLEEAHGLPENAVRLKALFAEHDAFLIASPEYNGLFTPLMKNTLDWISRPLEGGPQPFTGKLAGLVAASAGALGGIRGLPHLRQLLSNLGVLVMPAQLALARADTAFDADGQLRDAGQQKALERVVNELLRSAAALSA